MVRVALLPGSTPVVGKLGGAWGQAEFDTLLIALLPGSTPAFQSQLWANWEEPGDKPSLMRC